MSARPLSFLGQPVWPLPVAVWLIVAVAVAFVLIYASTVNGSSVFFMERPFGRQGWMYGWPLSHILMFFILGLVAPRYWFVLFMLGVLWELAELVSAAVHPKKEYWYAIAYDIVLNAMGLSLGASLGVLLRKEGTPASRKTVLAFFLCAVIVVGILLFMNDAWSYTLDRTLEGEPKRRQTELARDCGSIQRCAHI